MHPDVRRSTFLLAVSLAVAFAGVQITAGLGSVVVKELTGSLALTGLPFFVTNLGASLAAYPAGRLMDRYGRVPVLVAGHLLVAVGAAIGAAAILHTSLPLFIAGLAIAAAGSGATILTRLAAADLYPAARRGRGLALVVFAAPIGALLGLPLVWAADRVAPRLGQDQLLVVWALVPVLSATAALVVSRVRPDPREIALQIQALEPRPRIEGGTLSAARSTLGPLLGAAVALVLAHTAMASVMAVSGASLDDEGHNHTVVSAAMTGHLFGMFFFSPWIGHLGDRRGHESLLWWSAILLLLSTGAVVAYPHGATLAVALFVVGLGWSFAFIGSTALIANLVRVLRRGHVTGLVEMASSFTASAGSLLAGWALARGGLQWVGGYALLLSGGILASAVLASTLRTRGLPQPHPDA